MLRKLFILFMCSFIFICFPKKGFSLSIKDAFDEILIIHWQLSSVMTEMYKYFGWFWEEKKLLKEASSEAQKELNQLQAQIKKLEVPQELVAFKDKTLQLSSLFIDLCSKIEKKSKDTFSKELNSVKEFYTGYLEELQELSKKFSSIPERITDFSSLEEELKLINDLQDKQKYREALNLIKQKNFSQSQNILSELKEKYKNTDFEFCLILRIADCYLHPESKLINPQDIDKYQEFIDSLEKILDKDKYLPILYETFFKWRTNNQHFNSGMSNMSEIPNKYYNQKREKVIRTIKKYLKDNPQDSWAQAQLQQLLHLPNIKRGGPMGNDNLIYWGLLYYEEKIKEVDNP